MRRNSASPQARGAGDCYCRGYHYYDGNRGGLAQLGLDHLSWGSNGRPSIVS